MNFLVTLINRDGATHTEWAPMWPVPLQLTRAEKVEYEDLPPDMQKIADQTGALPMRLRAFVATGRADEMGARVYHEVLNRD